MCLVTTPFGSILPLVGASPEVVGCRGGAVGSKEMLDEGIGHKGMLATTSERPWLLLIRRSES